VFLFSTTSVLALGPTQPPIQWGCGEPVHEVGYSPPSSTETKNEDSSTCTLLICLHGVGRANFIAYLEYASNTCLHTVDVYD
jgi:hypothetical protein